MNKNKQKDSAPQKRRTTNEETEKRFLIAGVAVFLENGDLSQVQVQNDYGTIVLERNMGEKTVAHAIGFVLNDCDEDGEDYEDEENEQDEEETINKLVRWFL